MCVRVLTPYGHVCKCAYMQPSLYDPKLSLHTFMCLPVLHHPTWTMWPNPLAYLSCSSLLSPSAISLLNSSVSLTHRRHFGHLQCSPHAQFLLPLVFQRERVWALFICFCFTSLHSAFAAHLDGLATFLHFICRISQSLSEFFKRSTNVDFHSLCSGGKCFLKRHSAMHSQLLSDLEQFNCPKRTHV